MKHWECYVYKEHLDLPVAMQNVPTGSLSSSSGCGKHTGNIVFVECEIGGVNLGKDILPYCYGYISD